MADGGTLSLELYFLLESRDNPTPILFVLHGLTESSQESYVHVKVKDVCPPKAQGGAGIRAMNFRVCKSQFLSLIVIDEWEEFFPPSIIAMVSRVYSMLILVNLLVLSPSHFPVFSSFLIDQPPGDADTLVTNPNVDLRVWCKPAGLNNTLRIFWF